MPGCCNEPTCRRAKPILLRPGPFSNGWFVITDYTRDPNGRIRATAKHRLDDEMSAALTKAFDRADSIEVSE